MGGHNFQALRVHQNAKLRIASAWKAKADVPRWYNIVGTITPSQTLVRPQPRQHPLIYSRLQQVAGGDQVQIVETQAPRRKVRTKKASRIFQPVEIRYEEDELRKEFFKHHPWELARPRILLENDGKDYLKNNWKSMQQSHRSLDGERSVVLDQYL
jgi:small subunit ribosomal protein S23